MDTQPGSQIEAQVESTSNTNWDYRETFARPTMIQKARRSLHKPLTGLRRINPLGLNPIAPETTGPGTPSRKSFSSFFHRRSVASSHPTASQVSLLLEQSRGAGVPQSPPPLPPLYTAFPPVRPSSMPGRSTGLGQDETSGSLSPLKMRLPAHKLTSHHRISQVTNNSTESKANSIKSVPGWVKFHLPSGLQSGGTMTQESEKPLPSVPPGISPGLWLKTKVLPRFYSASDDVENGYRIGTGNGNKLEDTKQATFERNKSKEVQVGQRMSDPSAGSMMTGKLEV